MNKLRVFQNVKNKRTVTEFVFQNAGTVLLLFFFLPYLITALFGNLWKERQVPETTLLNQLEQGNYFVINETDFGRERIPLEIYVTDKLGRTMTENYEKEALKAQAILIRTGLLRKEEKEIRVSDTGYGKEILSCTYLEAVAETKGMYLAFEGKAVYAPYFEISNGFTRNAGEILENTEYPYLQGVVCEKDFMAEAYTDTRTYTLYELKKKWDNIPKTDIRSKGEIKGFAVSDEVPMQWIRDEAGYIRWIVYQGEWVTGEDFRYEFHLASADFQIQIRKDEIIFTTKGKGHGLGMSQFSANEMAKDGKNCIDILKYFFQNVSVSKTE